MQVDADAFVDTAGNGYVGISDAAELNFTTETVAGPTGVDFDLLGGDPSNLSGRQFDASTSSATYQLVDSGSASLPTVSSAQNFSSAANLGSDDRISTVSDGADVAFENQVAALESTDGAAVTFASASFDGATAGGSAGNDDAQLFEGLPADELFGNQNADLNASYLADIPIGILTSQGLV